MSDFPGLKQKAISNTSNLDYLNENEQSDKLFNFSKNKNLIDQNMSSKEFKEENMTIINESANSKVLDFPLKRKSENKLKIDNGHHKRHSTLMGKSFNNPLICLDNTNNLDKSFSSSLKKNLSPINNPEKIDDYYNKFSHLYTDTNVSTSKSPVRSSKSLIRINDDKENFQKNDNKIMKRFPTMISNSKPNFEDRNNFISSNIKQNNNIVTNINLDNYNSENYNSGYLDKSSNNLGYSENNNSNSQIFSNETKLLSSDVGKIQNNIIDIKSQLNTYEKVYDTINKHLDDQNVSKIKSLNDQINNLRRRLNEEEENIKHLKESHLKEIDFKDEFNRKEIKKIEQFYNEKIKSLDELNQLNINKINEGYEMVSLIKLQKIKQLKQRIKELETENTFLKQNDKKKEIAEYQKRYYSDVLELQKTFDDFKNKTSAEFKKLKAQRDEEKKKALYFEELYNNLLAEYEMNESSIKESEMVFKNKTENIKNLIKSNEILKIEVENLQSEVEILKYKLKVSNDKEKKLQSIAMESNFMNSKLDELGLNVNSILDLSSSNISIKNSNAFNKKNLMKTNIVSTNINSKIKVENQNNMNNLNSFKEDSNGNLDFKEVLISDNISVNSNKKHFTNNNYISFKPKSTNLNANLYGHTKKNSVSNNKDITNFNCNTFTPKMATLNENIDRFNNIEDNDFTNFQSFDKHMKISELEDKNNSSKLRLNTNVDNFSSSMYNYDSIKKFKK